MRRWSGCGCRGQRERWNREMTSSFYSASLRWLRSICLTGFSCRRWSKSAGKITVCRKRAGGCLVHRGKGSKRPTMRIGCENTWLGLAWVGRMCIRPLVITKEFEPRRCGNRKCMEIKPLMPRMTADKKEVNCSSALIHGHRWHQLLSFILRSFVVAVFFRSPLSYVSVAVSGLRLMPVFSKISIPSIGGDCAVVLQCGQRSSVSRRRLRQCGQRMDLGKSSMEISSRIPVNPRAAAMGSQMYFCAPCGMTKLEEKKCECGVADARADQQCIYMPRC